MCLLGVVMQQVSSSCITLGCLGAPTEMDPNKNSRVIIPLVWSNSCSSRVLESNCCVHVESLIQTISAWGNLQRQTSWCKQLIVDMRDNHTFFVAADYWSVRCITRDLDICLADSTFQNRLPVCTNSVHSCKLSDARLVYVRL